MILKKISRLPLLSIIILFRETPLLALGLTTWTRLSGLWRTLGQWVPGRGTCWCSPTSWCTAATPTPRTGEIRTWGVSWPWHWSGRGGCSWYRWRLGRTPPHLTYTGWPLMRIFHQCYNIICRSPCAGMIMRGTNTRQPADLDKRHENWKSMEDCKLRIDC